MNFSSPVHQLNASDFFIEKHNGKKGKELFSPPISPSCDCADAECERVEKKIKRANEKNFPTIFFLLLSVIMCNEHPHVHPHIPQRTKPAEGFSSFPSLSLTHFSHLCAVKENAMEKKKIECKSKGAKTI